MRKGKYAGVTSKLPRMPQGAGEDGDVSRSEKLKLVETEIALRVSMKSSALAREFAEIRAEKEAAERILSEIQLRLDAVVNLMVEQFEAEGLSSVRLDTGRLVSIGYEPYAQVVDKEAFRRWCIAHGLERSLQLWPSTTQKLVKDMLLAGDPEPDGIQTFSKPKIRLGSE